MGRKVLAAKSGRAACPNAAAGDGIAAKNAKGAKSFSTGFTGLREVSVKPAKTKPSGVAWLGDIPDGWKMMVGKHVYTVQAGAPFDSTKFSNVSGFPLVRIRDITSGKSETYYTGDYEAKDVVHDGDLLVGMDGDFHVRWWQGGEALLNQRCCKIQPRDVITSRFAYYFLPFALADINAIAYATTVKHLSNWDLENVRIPLPPLPEQRAIANYLDEKCGAIDAAVAEAKKGIEEYKAWKKSLIFEVVTGKRRVGFFNAESKCARDEVVGLPERSEPEGLQGAARRRVAEKMKSSGIPWIGDVPEGWKVMKLKYLIDVLPGYAFKSEGFDFSNGVRLLRGINVGVSSLKWDECVYWSSVINEELATYQIQDGDLIIGLDRPWIADGTRVCFAKKEDLPCLLVQRVCRLRSLGGVILQIVNYWLSSEGFESALSCETTGVSVPHISPGQIMEFRIALPSLHEQRAIADYLDEKCAAIDAMIAEKEALIADLEAYKKSLIYETVTGKREVK